VKSESPARPVGLAGRIAPGRGTGHGPSFPHRQLFAEAGVEPDPDTLEAAAWRAFQLEEGLFPRLGISEASAKRLLKSVYGGRLVARIDDGARVVLREATSCEWLP